MVGNLAGCCCADNGVRGKDQICFPIRDVIVERGVVIASTEVAVEMRMQFPQASEALDNVGAHRTNELPVHIE